jgi:hypothetical protein
MKRAGTLLFVAGAALLAVGLLLSLWLGAAAMPSYAADWLFWSSLPLGALLLVMLLDLAGPGAGFGIEPVLRRMLWLTPLAGLLLIPLLVRPGALFGWAQGHGFHTPFGRFWMTNAGFVARGIVYFVLWSFLAVFFSTPPSVSAVERRRGFAAFGLFVYLVTGTLAAVDWAMAVEPDWYSSAFGLLLLAAQASIAVSVAVLLAGEGWHRAMPEPAAAGLLLPLFAWFFLQLMQYLVIWSADKPADITWYLHRSNGGSNAVAVIAVVLGLLVPLALLLSPVRRRWRPVLPAVALAVLVVQAVGMLWLVTPSIREHFTLTGMDVLELAGLGGVMLGATLLAGAARAAYHPVAGEASAHG